MKTNVVSVGIMPRKQHQRYLLDVARGRARLEPDTPKIWFSSLESMHQLLSTHNLELLRLIATRRPGSITELAQLSGRDVANLSRTLKSLASAGLVTLVKTDTRAKRPEVTATDFKIEFSLLPAGK